MPGLGFWSGQKGQESGIVGPIEPVYQSPRAVPGLSRLKRLLYTGWLESGSLGQMYVGMTVVTIVEDQLCTHKSLLIWLYKFG